MRMLPEERFRGSAKATSRVQKELNLPVEAH